MSATPESTLSNPEQVIADLQRQLAECKAERDEALGERAELQRKLAERTAERDEALQRETATTEVLQVINSSHGDLAPVFDAMLQTALTLCGAAFGLLETFDGLVFRAAAWRGYEPGPSATAPTPGMALYQLVHGEQIVHIPDITADDVYRSGNAVRRRLADEYGGRTAIWVALRKDAALLGAFVIYRTEVRRFSDKQIAVLQSFAAQAVIAMENARLLNEIRHRQAELRVTFDNMGDGVAMFDAELRLAAWNLNFQDIIEMSDSFLPSGRAIPPICARWPSAANSAMSMSRPRSAAASTRSISRPASSMSGPTAAPSRCAATQCRAAAMS